MRLETRIEFRKFGKPSNLLQKKFNQFFFFFEDEQEKHDDRCYRRRLRFLSPNIEKIRDRFSESFVFIDFTPFTVPPFFEFKGGW